MTFSGRRTIAIFFNVRWCVVARSIRERFGNYFSNSEVHRVVVRFPKRSFIIFGENKPKALSEPSTVTSKSSATRLLLIGKQDAGFVRKTLTFCDDLTFDEYGANTSRRNWHAKSVSIAIYFAKTFKKSEVLAAACTIFITQIGGLRP